MADITTKEERTLRELVADSLDASAIADAVSSVLRPQYIYGEDALSQWAEENGFVRKSDALLYCEESGLLLEAGWKQEEEGGLTSSPTCGKM